MKKCIEFPLNISNGDISLTEDHDCVKSSIMNIITTLPGEAITLPQFGVNDYVLESYRPASAVSDIETAIQTWGDYPVEISYSKDPTLIESGILDLRVKYGVRDTSNVINLSISAE